MSRKAKTRTSSKLAEIFTIDEILTAINVDQTDWDVLLIGDGSGSSWTYGGGYAVLLIDRHSGQAKHFYGAMNVATTMLAELLPYMHAMCWYSSGVGPGRLLRKQLVYRKLRPRIHIITDSENVCQCGNMPESRHSHKAIWSAFDTFTEQGYSLRWHHVQRNQIGLNVLADALSRQARLDLDGCYGRAIKVLQRKYPGMPDNVTVSSFFVPEGVPDESSSYQ